MCFESLTNMVNGGDSTHAVLVPAPVLFAHYIDTKQSKVIAQRPWSSGYDGRFPTYQPGFKSRRPHF